MITVQAVMRVLQVTLSAGRALALGPSVPTDGTFSGPCLQEEGVKSALGVRSDCPVAALWGPGAPSAVGGCWGCDAAPQIRVPGARSAIPARLRALLSPIARSAGREGGGAHNW